MSTFCNLILREMFIDCNVVFHSQRRESPFFSIVNPIHDRRHGVPLVEKLFTGGFKRRNSCIQLIKTFQQSTRFYFGSKINLCSRAWCRYMQNVCCHSKLTASVSLANHVPLVKRALEVFVYRFYSFSRIVSCLEKNSILLIQYYLRSTDRILCRAKAMLAANNCSEAFSLGTLVNR